VATADKKTNPADDLGADQVQAAFDEANEKGYFGETPDETPNENYTLAGVTSGKPTPETERGKK
jgi:hypothetical protein